MIGPVAAALSGAVALWTASLLAYLVTWAAVIGLAVVVGVRWADPWWFRRGGRGLATTRFRSGIPLALSAAAAVALAAGDRVIVGATLGEASLGRYQAAYAVGNLAVMAGSALSNHWLPGLMRGEAEARRGQLLGVGAIAVAGAVVAVPALHLLLPSSYAPADLWPVAVVAALSAVPFGLCLQAQARATHLGRTRAVGASALAVTSLAMVGTLVVALTTASLVQIALVTPLSYAVLAVRLRRGIRTADAATTEDRYVVVLSSIRWNYLWQRHQSLAAAAAEQSSVVFVESQPRRLRQLLTTPLKALRSAGTENAGQAPPAGVRLVGPSPLAVLAPRLWARAQARRILREAGNGPVDVILYAPTRAYLTLAKLLSDRGARVTYDAVMDWALAPAHYHPPRQPHQAEASLPAQWRVVSDNPTIALGLQARLGRHVQVVPPAADAAFLDHPWRSLDEREPVLGWFGAIHSEVDVDLLCAASRAGIRVETVGPQQDASAAARLAAAGVTMLGTETIEALPARIQHWRVALLAYTGDRSAMITPAKLLNALVAFRVAVRGIALPGAFSHDVVVLPDDDDQAVAVLRALVDRPGNRADISAHDLSWRDRLGDITGAAR
jgi:hypothetical protein